MWSARSRPATGCCSPPASSAPSPTPGSGRVAAATAVAWSPAGAKGQALPWSPGGLTLATVVGVPAGTVLSQHAGWRAAFWARHRAHRAQRALAAGRAARGHRAGGEPLSVRSEMRGLARPALWVSYLVTTLTFGAVGRHLQLSRPAADRGERPARAVGAGGARPVRGRRTGRGRRSAGGSPTRCRCATLFTGVGALTVTSAALALTAGSLGTTIALVFVLGFTAFVVNPVVQSRVFRLAPGAPMLAGALNTSAFNVGITLTPMLGGLDHRRGPRLHLGGLGRCRHRRARPGRHGVGGGTGATEGARQGARRRTPRVRRRVGRRPGAAGQPVRQRAGSTPRRRPGRRPQRAIAPASASRTCRARRRGSPSRPGRMVRTASTVKSRLR